MESLANSGSSGDAPPKNACVSAVGKAEESDVLRWDLCTVGGEVETLANFGLKLGRTAQRRVSRLQVKLRKRGVPVGPFVSGCRGRKSRNFLEAVETHRPKACVSAVGKAEEARCYGGNFESLLQRWKLSQIFG